MQYVMELLRASWGWICYFSPIKLTIVHQGQLGCRRTFGQPGANLDSSGRMKGLYFATCGQTLESVQALNCKIDLGEISVPLADRIPVKVAAAMTYDVVDAGAWMSNSEDAEWLMSEIQEAELRESLMHSTYEALVEDICVMEGEAMKRAQERIDELQLGGRIKYLRVKHLVVTETSAQTALFINKLTEALLWIPADLRGDPALPAMVALLSGAQPVNTMVRQAWSQEEPPAG
jgi:hypothetical protein